MCIALESTNPPRKWTVAKIEINTMGEKRLEVVSEYPLNNFNSNGSDLDIQAQVGELFYF